MKRVIIIGGGFAGTEAAMILEKKFDVTLIDRKDYFEFTPSILKLSVDPNYSKKIRTDHKKYLKNSTIIKGDVKTISDKYVLINNKKLFYDYLILSSGAFYGLKIKDKKIFSGGNSEELIKSSKKLDTCKEILIVGGGLVGVELAGELLDKYNNTKEITIVNSANSVMERNHQRAIYKVDNFLRKRGVKIINNTKAFLENTDKIKTDSNLEMSADIIFLCTGISPNSYFMKNKFSKNLGVKSAIIVNENLQLLNKSNIFAAGDVNSIKEEKTAQNAIKQGRLIANNIINLERGIKLKEYKAKRRPLVISLGKYYAVLEYKNFVISGIIPAMIKYFVEKKGLFKYQVRGLLNQQSSKIRRVVQNHCEANP